MRECVICKGSGSPFTVGEDEDGERALVHVGACASELNNRKQKAARTRGDVKTATISRWETPWGPGRYGYDHILPCPCPKHRKIEKDGGDLEYR